MLLLQQESQFSCNTTCELSDTIDSHKTRTKRKYQKAHLRNNRYFRQNVLYRGFKINYFWLFIMLIIILEYKYSINITSGQAFT